MLMVPSAAMGRDIPVAFHDGGAHRVVLLDAFNGGADVSNWVARVRSTRSRARGSPWRRRPVALGAFTRIGMPTAASSGRRFWPTSCRTGWQPTRVSLETDTASYARPRVAPPRWRWRPSIPDGTDMPVRCRVLSRRLERRDHAGLAQFGGVNTQAMWGAAQLGRWKWHDPDPDRDAAPPARRMR